ncbi:M1 family metallopeptidase [Actinomadura barringtoniae]|uniref:Aminopeptidase N n=1 Tax=Actinomadura barringtoniae TaxID=1427535 RepID=A0A939PCV8_9ACTN|nr:M1 family metallopeptidase [Actinomadura barringtoniae]
MAAASATAPAGAAPAAAAPTALTAPPAAPPAPRTQRTRRTQPGPAPGLFKPGAAGVGDPYFPKAGNGGFDVAHYDIALAYAPAERRIQGTTRITATATQDLSRFDLDFLGNKVRSVTVDNVRATFSRDGQELVVTPRAGLRKGARFTVAVTYAGTPPELRDPVLGQTGWITTEDGAITLSQPFGSASWFPVNDHPADKATFSYAIKVPNGLDVVANGEPDGTSTGGRETTFRWHSDRQMATYLALVAIGRFEVTDGRSPGGVRVITAVDPAVTPDGEWLQRTTGEVTDWEAGIFGPFPFGSSGGVVDDAPVGYALETQNRPTYPGGADTKLIVHELAHQWFGDSVSLKSWRDIWLNEGFATYAEWLWSEQHGGRSAARQFAEAYKEPADSPAWRQRTGDPGHDALFEFFPTYSRGAMLLHMLRTTVGDEKFFKILRAWPAEHAQGNATTADFRALAARISGQKLDRLFETWLYTPGKPDLK